jgi:hypothetical protein
MTLDPEIQAFLDEHQAAQKLKKRQAMKELGQFLIDAEQQLSHKDYNRLVTHLGDSLEARDLSKSLLSGAIETALEEREQ